MAGTKAGQLKREATFRHQAQERRAALAGQYPDEWNELPLTRTHAKELGSTFFFHAKPCKHGHLSRYQTCGVCEECHRLYRTSEQGHKAQRANHTKRMATEPDYRQAKRDETKRYYDRNKDNDEWMEKQRVRCRNYQSTERGKQKTREAMARFVEAGKKAESDARYLATARGRDVARAAKKRHVKKVEAEHGKSYTAVVWERNPQAKLHSRMNTLISTALKRVGVAKSMKTVELVGCSIENLKAHLESNFEEGMSWDNYSRHGWHIDHIRPTASFDLNDPDQQRTANNWRNLIPMWAADNISKGDRYDHQDEQEWIDYMLALGFEGSLFRLFD